MSTTSSIDLTARDAKDLAMAGVDYADQMVDYARGYTSEFMATVVRSGEPAWTKLGDAIDSLRAATRKLEAVEHLRPTFDTEVTA